MQKTVFQFFGLIFLLAIGNLHAEYFKNPAVSLDVWREAEPYFLPETHPTKKVLDRIFSQVNPIENYKALSRAGFKFSLPEDRRKLVCAKHSKIKGYLIKTFTNEQTHVTQEHLGWIQRIEGARQIQKCIDRHGYRKIMKVPKKWIYPLPYADGKHFILIVEDMDLLKGFENGDAYVLDMNKARLNALYVVLTENLLIDSIFIDNIPFSKDGKIAFIDTEHFNNRTKRLKLERLTKRFSPTMALHWMALIHNFKQVGFEE